MAGGTGSRLWPVSRAAKPKQFLDVAETGKTFIRQTYDWFLKIVPQENILVVTANKYRDLVKEQIPELAEGNLLLEPYSRNTAPALVYATYTLLQRNPDAYFVAMPSDYIIENEEMFAHTIYNACEYVEKNDVLLTFGVVPTRPETNFGYAQVVGGRNAIQSNTPLKVKTFTEKPDMDLARILVNSGEFLWNAGIFVWKAATVRDELEKHLPQVTGMFAGWEKMLGTENQTEFITKAFADSMNISLAYGLMEKTDRAWIYPVGFGWQDVVAWGSLYNYMTDRDADGNAVSAGKVLMEDNKDTLVISPIKKKLVAVKGLEDYIIVDTDDVLLICPKDDKKFKDFISEIGMPEFEKYR
jgi:mannose-1-phosphate guanylyltransferase